MIKTVQAVVIGAGPAGSRAAYALASNKIETILLEKKPKVGTPVRCGEGIGWKGFNASGLELLPKWVSATVTESIFYSPSGLGIHAKMEDAYILDRTVFDFDIAEIAKQAGAELQLESTVLQIAKNSAGWKLLVHCGGEEREIHAKLVLIADGVESRLGRQAGLTGTIGMDDLEVCAQYLLDGVEINQNRILFYPGWKWAPGGYAWVFPKGGNKANVGLGVLGKHAQNYRPIRLLDAFVKEHFPNAQIIRRNIGSVPVGMALKNPVADGILLSGDAARQVNCLNGGGLSYALSAGYMAGQVAAKALKRNDVSSKILSEYVTWWKRGLGKQQKRSYHLKEAVVPITDEQLNKIAQKMQNKNSGSLVTLAGIFSGVFISRPILLLKALKLLS
jgi:digeranylgeranylglycerophospholipid reductase